MNLMGEFILEHCPISQQRYQSWLGRFNLDNEQYMKNLILRNDPNHSSFNPYKHF